MYILGGLSYNSDGSYREAEGALQCTLTQIPGKCRAVVGETRLRICEGRGMDVVGLHVGWGRDNTREVGFTYNNVCVWGGGGGGGKGASKPETTNRRISVCGAG